MNDTEQLIKDALGKLAERTPHPGPTLNALRRKRKSHRNVFLIATAGVAAVAVLIFAGLVASNRYQPLNHDDAAAALMPAGGQGVALKYTPHWLPDGVVETYRGVGDEISRIWVPAGTKGNPKTVTGEREVTVRKIKKLPGDLARWQEVSVRGLKAWVLTSQDEAHGPTADVVWQAQDVLGVTVRGIDDARQVALHVADSVRADTKITYVPTFTLDGRGASETWGTSPSDWTSVWTSDKFGVTVSTSPPAKTDGALVTVRGQKGSLVNQSAVVVRDSSGFWIAVEGEPGSRDRLVDAANRVQLQIVPSPDTTWIGRGL